jgi:hypothetical protein
VTIFPIFYIISDVDWIDPWNFHKSLFGVLWTNAQWKQHFTYRCKWIYNRNLYIYWIICEQLLTRNLHVMLLYICKFCESRCRECRTLLMGVNGITYTRVPWNRMIFWKYKTFPYYVTESTICRLVNVIRRLKEQEILSSPREKVLVVRNEISQRWVCTRCSLVDRYGHFGGPYCLPPQDRGTLKVKAALSSQTFCLPHYRPHITEDCNFKTSLFLNVIRIFTLGLFHFNVTFLCTFFVSLAWRQPYYSLKHVATLCK